MPNYINDYSTALGKSMAPRIPGLIGPPISPKPRPAANSGTTDPFVQYEPKELPGVSYPPTHTYPSVITYPPTHSYPTTTSGYTDPFESIYGARPSAGPITYPPTHGYGDGLTNLIRILRALFGRG